MKLFKQHSKRLNPKVNAPYVDLYLGWVYQGHNFVVRVCPTFNHDYDKLIATAQEVPPGELIEKYM